MFPQGRPALKVLLHWVAKGDVVTFILNVNCVTFIECDTTFESNV